MITDGVWLRTVSSLLAVLFFLIYFFGFSENQRSVPGRAALELGLTSGSQHSPSGSTASARSAKLTVMPDEPRSHSPAQRVFGPRHHVERKEKKKKFQLLSKQGLSKHAGSGGAGGRGRTGRPCAMSAASPERVPAPAGQGAARGPCGLGDTPVWEGGMSPATPATLGLPLMLPGTQVRAGVPRRGGAALGRSPCGSAGLGLGAP